MHRQIGKQHQHAEPIADLFTHADDSAAANLEPGLARVGERIDAILHRARGDDLAVEFRRGIDVVIVEVESGVAQPLRLIGREHAERRAGLQPQPLDGADHIADPVEVLVLRIAPRRCHAEPACARVLGALRGREYLLRIHQLGGLDAGVVVGALRAVAAIFRATAGLDAEQTRRLDVIGVEVSAVNALRAENQIRERLIV